MRTDHVLFFADNSTSGNFTSPAALDIINGTGHITPGYFSSYCRVEGLDLVLEVLIVQMILQVFILAAIYHFTTKVNNV